MGAVPRQRAHAAAPCRIRPGAAASLVSFIALFGGTAIMTRTVFVATPITDGAHFIFLKIAVIVPAFITSISTSRRDLTIFSVVVL